MINTHDNLHKIANKVWVSNAHYLHNLHPLAKNVSAFCDPKRAESSDTKTAKVEMEIGGDGAEPNAK